MSEWELILKWMPKMLQGAALTLELLAIAVVAGLALALLLGIARASRHWYVRAVPYAYIFFFRGTPLLLQLFIVYYGLAQFEEARKSAFWPYLRDPYWCALLTMTLHTAAYIAEILRGAIHWPGEVEAARALGMSRRQALLAHHPARAVRIGLPAYSNEVILMLKASAVVHRDPVRHHGHGPDHHRPHLRIDAVLLPGRRAVPGDHHRADADLPPDRTLVAGRRHRAAERALSDAGAAIIASPFSRCRLHRVRNLPVPHWRRPVAALPRAGRVPPRTPAALATPPVQRTDPGVAEHAELASWLRGRSLEQADAEHNQPTRLAAPAAYPQLAAQAAALGAVGELPLAERPQAPNRFNVDVPGRKWQQISLFAGRLQFARPGPLARLVLRQGHLGRLLAHAGNR